MTYPTNIMKVNDYNFVDQKTAYTPNIPFKIGCTILDIDIEKLAQTCLEKEEEIMQLPPSVNLDNQPLDGNTGLGPTNTTSRFSKYNVLDWNTNETNSLKKYIRENVEKYNQENKKETPEKLWVRCWVNVMRKGQSIKKHVHDIEDTCYLSCHLTVQCHETSTIYVNPLTYYPDPHLIDEKNIPRQLTIFPSFIPHYTTTHKFDKERITIAMDIKTQNFNIGNHITDQNWRMI